MSKSEQSKLNYNARRELRLRRDKAATALLAAMLPVTLPAAVPPKETIPIAVKMADDLIAELDKSRPDLKGEPA